MPTQKVYDQFGNEYNKVGKLICGTPANPGRTPHIRNSSTRSLNIYTSPHTGEQRTLPDAVAQDMIKKGYGSQIESRTFQEGSKEHIEACKIDANLNNEQEWRDTGGNPTEIFHERPADPEKQNNQANCVNNKKGKAKIFSDTLEKDNADIESDPQQALSRIEKRHKELQAKKDMEIADSNLRIAKIEQENAEEDAKEAHNTKTL